MGTRLGIGTTKALVDVAGKPLIIHQLEILNEYEDIRVVVGYQMEKVIDVVTKYRKDITFVINHNYKTTGTGASFSLGAKFAQEYVVSLDGDLLVNPVDLLEFLQHDGECIGGTIPTTDNPVLMQTISKDNKRYVTKFSRDKGEYEWTGLVKVHRSHLTEGTGHVYQLLEPSLPLEMRLIRSREIDTMNDYYEAVRWVKNNYI